MRKERIHELAETIKVVEGFNAKDHMNPTGPCVSIYVPTKRTEREDRRDEWDKIEFKNLAEDAKRSMKEKHPDADS